MKIWLLAFYLTMPNGQVNSIKFSEPYEVLSACQDDGNAGVKKLSLDGQLIDRHWKLAYRCLPVGKL